MRVLGLLVVTLFADFIWLLYWIPFWTSGMLGDWEKSIHYAVIFCSAMEVVLKIILIILHCTTQKDAIKKEFPVVEKFFKLEESKAQ